MKVPSRLYPPHYLVLSIASIIGIDWLVPVPFVAAAFALIGGLLFLVIGLILAASAARLFSKAKTGIVPLVNQQNWSSAEPTVSPAIRCI